MIKVIADSGGTKTDWAITDGDQTTVVKGQGLHPAYVSSKEIAAEVRKVTTRNPDQVWFYGAGCYGVEPVQKVKAVLIQIFPDANVHVTDDLTGVARAHLRERKGVIAALGTGSICGEYERGQVVRRSAALGYAIGDEGSAVDLGRSILKAFFRNTLPEESHMQVADRLESTEYSVWMRQIYNSSRPNRVLAAIAGQIFHEPMETGVRSILADCLARFMDTQLAQIDPSRTSPVVFSGSVAIAHPGLIQMLMEKRGFKNVEIKSDVIGGLVAYHSGRMSE